MKKISRVFVFSGMVLLSANGARAQETLAENSADSTAIETASAWRFAAGLSLHTGSKLKFHAVNRTGVTGDSGADVDLRNAVSVDLDLRYLRPDRWGMIFGLSFDSEREITGGEFTGAAWGIPYTGTGDTVRVAVLSGSAAYRWSRFYIPFGFNLSRVQYEKASGNPGSYDEMGGIGAQFGIGCYVGENTVIELLSRSVAVKLDHTDGATSTEYHRGFLSSVSLGAKYLF